VTPTLDTKFYPPALAAGCTRDHWFIAELRVALVQLLPHSPLAITKFDVVLDMTAAAQKSVRFLIFVWSSTRNKVGWFSVESTDEFLRYSDTKIVAQLIGEQLVDGVEHLALSGQ